MLCAGWLDYSDYLTIVAVTGILLCIALLMGRYTTFFTVDQDIKYLASLSLTHHWNDAAIPYAFQGVDPRGLYTCPSQHGYTGISTRGTRSRLNILVPSPWHFSEMRAWLCRQLLGTAALLLIQLRFASLLGLQGHRTTLIVATVVATPVFFYSLVFWEHTWGVAFLLGGIAVLLTLANREAPNILGGGLAGGLFAGGVLMRREVLIPALVTMVLIPGLFRSRAVLISTAAAAATLLVTLGAIFLLDPQPLMVGLTHASPGRAGISPGATSNRLRRFEWLTSGGYATGLFIGCTVLLAGIRQMKRRWLPTAYALSSVIVGLTFAIQLFSYYKFSDLNPLAFCPIALWGLWSVLLVPKKRAIPASLLAIWTICLVGAIGTTVMAADFGGVQWGPRYLLFVFPLAIVLAFWARQNMRQIATGAFEKRAVEFSFVGVLALSVLLQVGGVLAIVKGKQVLYSSQATISQLPTKTVVAADSSIDGLAPLAGKKVLLYSPT